MYKPISEYGLIGNCRSVCLVSSEASIDWACLPDFDSPAQFLKILDEKEGGFFQICPSSPETFKTYQKYLKNTNVLETIFFNQEASISIKDFMPISRQEEEANDPSVYGTKVVRLVKALRGNHEFELKLKVTPNFAQEKVEVYEKEDMVICENGTYKLVLHKKHHQVKIKADLVIVKFSLKRGEQEFFSLDFLKKEDPVTPIAKDVLNAKLADLYFNTIDFWHYWVSKCSYEGSYWDEIIRSALTLKMLTYSPTGAVVAAPTSSLPEKLGGSFNWDYRFTWLRDASFTIYAFLGLGYLKEAERFIQWLENTCFQNSDDLQIMYSVKGEKNLEEQKLSHLAGYMDSQPVRIGNEAAGQKQIDIFGEVLSVISLYIDCGGKIPNQTKPVIKKLVDYCCKHWQEKDAGIWEPRYGHQHNTYSKLCCWMGLDRGIKMAKELKIKDVDLKSWEKTKEEIRDDILEHGYNKKINSFVGYYNSEVLDTSTLHIPLVGFLPPEDKRVVGTVDKIMSSLVVDWFVLRNMDPADPTKKGEGTFFLSTFWLIDVLSIAGRVDEARFWLERILNSASPLGLFAEEFDPITKIHLGNYPQAFSHLGLINSILNLRQAEIYGEELQATNQTERLKKVIKTILIGKDKYKTQGPLKKLLKTFFRKY